MRLKIADKGKQEIFVALFQLLKNWNGYVTMDFNSEKLYIQAMDKSHVCLAIIDISGDWFTEYNCPVSTKLSVDSSNLCALMTFSLKHNITEFLFDDATPDKLFIHFLNDDTVNVTAKTKDKKSSFNHYFELSLVDVDEDTLGVPTVDYDVEFNIEAKLFVEVLTELNTFGQDLHIQCSEKSMDFYTNGDATKLTVNIPIAGLDEYAIAEDESFNLSFSLNHLCKMCCSTKLGQNVGVCLSNEFPMALEYDLGIHSSAIFFVAPKVSE